MSPNVTFEETNQRNTIARLKLVVANLEEDLIKTTESLVKEHTLRHGQVMNPQNRTPFVRSLQEMTKGLFDLESRTKTTLSASMVEFAALESTGNERLAIDIKALGRDLAALNSILEDREPEMVNIANTLERVFELLVLDE